MLIPLVIQHRHVHLSKADTKRLFGDERAMHISSSIGHHGQYVFQETVDVEGKTGVIEFVSILGPSREKTQVELSTTDAFAIGLKVPLRHSGDIVRTASCTLVGSKGSVRVSSAVIVPARHLHCSEKDAKRLRLKNHQVISLKQVDRDDVVFNHVFVRVHPTFNLEFHLTPDEAAHYWLQSGDLFDLC